VISAVLRRASLVRLRFPSAAEAVIHSPHIRRGLKPRPFKTEAKLLEAASGGVPDKSTD